jgi:hypothetical protein
MSGGMITSTIHVLILVPVFFVLMKERALRSREPLAESQCNSCEKRSTLEPERPTLAA